MNIEELLFAWGAWSRSGVLPKQPRCSITPPSARDIDDPLPISREMAEKVDAAMLAIGEDAPEASRVLLSRYLYGNFDDRDVGRRLRLHERTVRARRQEGHAYVKGFLSGGISV